MAARETQGYLIAVICLVLLSLVLALSTFLGINKATEYADSKKSAEDKLAVEQKIAKANLIEAEILRAYVGDFGKSVAEVAAQIDSLDQLKIGASDADNVALNDVFTRVKEVRTGYEDDMKMFMSATEEADQVQEPTWRGLTRNLNTLVAKMHNDLNVRQSELLQAAKDHAARVSAMKNKLEVTEKALADEQANLKSEQDRNKNKEGELQAALDAMEAKNVDDNKRFQIARSQFTTRITNLENENKNIKEDNLALAEKVKSLTAEDFNLPDGRIVRVAHSINRVFLNIGKADGLRPNRTFAIYDSKINNFEKGRHKAMVEVTRITGPHQAEARITDEDPVDPILPDDYVLTATWDPGYSVPIALVGMFDLDGDGNSDRDQLIQQIQNNGGKVVAYHDDDGKQVGKIDSATRYLVLGEVPDPGNISSTALYRAIDKLKESGAKYTVQEIDTRKLLNWMGRHGRPAIERLDSKIGDAQRRRSAEFLKARDQ